MASPASSEGHSVPTTDQIMRDGDQSVRASPHNARAADELAPASAPASQPTRVIPSEPEGRLESAASRPSRRKVRAATTTASDERASSTTSAEPGRPLTEHRDIQLASDNAEDIADEDTPMANAPNVSQPLDIVTTRARLPRPSRRSRLPWTPSAPASSTAPQTPASQTDTVARRLWPEAGLALKLSPSKAAVIGGSGWRSQRLYIYPSSNSGRDAIIKYRKSPASSTYSV
jgi:hypothetical protein